MVLFAKHEPWDPNWDKKYLIEKSVVLEVYWEVFEYSDIEIDSKLTAVSCRILEKDSFLLEVGLLSHKLALQPETRLGFLRIDLSWKQRAVEDVTLEILQVGDLNVKFHPFKIFLG